VVPSEFLVPYVIANTAALVILSLALWKPAVGRWCAVAVFLWAALTNARVALQTPGAYLEYATLTPFALYRGFINGWFSAHVRDMVLPIAAGQLIIAILMMLPRPWRTLGTAGAIVFLLAIAPLGVGSGFPFSVTFGAAVIVANRDGRGFLGTEEKRGREVQAS
jgi:hypothetical protein